MGKKWRLVLLVFLFSLTNIIISFASDVNIGGFDPKFGIGHNRQDEIKRITVKGARISLWNADTNELIDVLNILDLDESNRNDYGSVSKLTKVEIAQSGGELPREIMDSLDFGSLPSASIYSEQINLPKLVIEKGENSANFINNLKNWWGNKNNVDKICECFNPDESVTNKCFLVEPLLVLYSHTDGFLFWKTVHYNIFTSAEIGILSHTNNLVFKSNRTTDYEYDEDCYKALPFSCFKKNAGVLKSIPPYNASSSDGYCDTEDEFMDMVKSLGCFEVYTNTSVATKSEIVKKNVATPSEIKEFDMEYYVNSYVITSVDVKSSMGFPRQSYTPRTNKDYDAKNGCLTEKLAEITYTFDSSEDLDIEEYTHKIAIPENGSAVSWVKWKCPSVPCEVVIDITTNNADALPSVNRIIVKVVDPINGLYPPNPEATDRNDGFISPQYATGNWNKGIKRSLTWSTYTYKWNYYWVWGCSRTMENGSLTEWGRSENWDYDYICEKHICPPRDNHICPTGRCHDVKEDWGWVSWEEVKHTLTLDTENERLYRSENSPNTNNSDNSIKSGYGVEISIDTYCTYKVNGERKNIEEASSAVVPPQYMEVFLPEHNFENYEITTFKDLDEIGYGEDDSFNFPVNPYSQFGQKCHFTPLWYPDGKYVVGAKISQCFCPAGMLSISNDDISININGNAYDDWHIAPEMN